MIIKAFFRVFLILFIVLFVIAGSFVAWVATGPRSLALLAPYVEEELNQMSPDHDVRIGRSFVKWDQTQRSITISVDNVLVLHEERIVFNIKELLFDFDLWRFLQGTLLSSDIVVVEPSLMVNTAGKALYIAPQDKVQLKQTVLYGIHTYLKSHKHSFTFRSLNIQQGKLFISNGQSDLVWQIEKGTFAVEKQESGKRVFASMDINFGTLASFFSFEAQRLDNGLVDANVTFEALPSYAVTDVFPALLEVMEPFDLLANGAFSFLMNEQGSISQLHFNMRHLSGHVNYPELFPEPLQIKAITSRGNFYHDFTSLRLDELYANIGNAKAYLYGSVDGLGKNSYPSVDITANGSNIKVDRLRYYWPRFLGTKVRYWIKEHIFDGTIKEAKARFKMTPDDIKALVERKKMQVKPVTSPISDQSIKAFIKVEGATVSVHQAYPLIKDIDANVTITGQKMHAAISKARLEQSEITEAMVAIDNMWHRPATLVAKGKTKGKLQEYIGFLRPSQTITPPPKAMQSILSATGEADGHFTLSLPLKKPLTYEDMALVISANVTEGALPQFIKDNDVSKASFTLGLDHDYLHIIGNGKVVGLDAFFGYQQFINDPDAPFDRKYDISAYSSAQQLQALGVHVPYISGAQHVQLHVVDKDHVKQMRGTINLTDTAINISPYSITKPINEKAELNFSGTIPKEGSIEIEKFSMQSASLTAKGTMRFKQNFAAVEALTLADLQAGENHLNLAYERSDTQSTIALKGAYLDMSQQVLGDFFTKKSTYQNALQLDVNLTKVKMKNGQYLHDVEANLACNAGQCSTVNVYSKVTDDRFFALGIKPLGDRLSLMVESDNAGAVLYALGISKHVKGGTLNIDATYAKQENDEIVARGNARIRDFTAIKTPTLGKILTLASFQGISDLLNQNGISFKKFEAPFELSQGVIHVKEAKSSGSSVGITADGTINLRQKLIDLKGVIVPAYAVNKVLGNIPVFGQILVGKENEGVLATRYSVKGAYDNVKATVNPLSILAPGILRNLFDILDEGK